MTEEVKLRTRPKSVPVRIRERPFDPYAWMKPVTVDPVQGYRELTPEMPKTWPSGSSLMRGTQTKGFKRFNMKPGVLDEENPNLLGRCIIRSDGRYWLWGWRNKHYVYMGIFPTMGEMFAELQR